MSQEPEYVDEEQRRVARAKSWDPLYALLFFGTIAGVFAADWILARYSMESSSPGGKALRFAPGAVLVLIVLCRDRIRSHASGIRYYQSGRYGLAERAFRRHADVNVEAARLLGDMYFSGKGMPADREKALRFYRQSFRNLITLQTVLTRDFAPGTEPTPEQQRRLQTLSRNAASFLEALPDILFAADSNQRNGVELARDVYSVEWLNLFDPEKALAYAERAAADFPEMDNLGCLATLLLVQRPDEYDRMLELNRRCFEMGGRNYGWFLAMLFAGNRDPQRVDWREAARYFKQSLRMTLKADRKERSGYENATGPACGNWFLEQGKEMLLNGEDCHLFARLFQETQPKQKQLIKRWRQLAEAKAE